MYELHQIDAFSYLSSLAPISTTNTMYLAFKNDYKTYDVYLETLIISPANLVGFNAKLI